MESGITEKNVFYCSGDRDIDNNWNVVAVRRLTTGDPITFNYNTVTYQHDFNFAPYVNSPFAAVPSLVAFSYAYHETDSAFTQYHCRYPTATSTTCNPTTSSTNVNLRNYQVCHSSCKTPVIGLKNAISCVAPATCYCDGTLATSNCIAIYCVGP